MTKIFNLKNVTIGSLLLVTIFGIGLYTNMIKLPIGKEINSDALYVTDFSDDRKLMGSSHNVFVGKIIKQVGNEDIGIGPVTQFEVEVIGNIKGDLNGTVVILQQIGYENGILHAPHGGSLMQPGETYLLATRNSDGQGWYYVNPHPNGSKLISRDATLDKIQLQNLAKNDEKTMKLQEAYKNEILLVEDVEQNNTRNSYQSLQKSR